MRHVYISFALGLVLTACAAVPDPRETATQQGMALVSAEGDTTNAIGAEQFFLDGLAYDPVDTDAMLMLARGYENGWYGAGEDTARACGFYLQAAELDFAAAYWRTGMCFLNGEGVEKNDATAFEWIEKSADAGAQDGLVSFAMMTAMGQATEKDPAKAAAAYGLAIRHGGPLKAHAMRGLGGMHLFGELPESNPTFGYALLEIAKEIGDPMAPRLLARVSELKPDIRAAVEAEKLRLRAEYKIN